MSEQSPISANGMLLRVGDLVTEADGTGRRRTGIIESVGISSTSNRLDGVLVRLPTGDVSSLASRWSLEGVLVRLPTGDVSSLASRWSLEVTESSEGDSDS